MRSGGLVIGPALMDLSSVDGPSTPHSAKLSVESL